MNRIRDYLIIGDVKLIDIPASSNDNPACILIKKADFKWKTQDENNALTNVSLKIDKFGHIFHSLLSSFALTRILRKRKLTMIVGSVGSGKSCLATAILGQVPLVSGELKVSGSIAYVPQTAWILNDSVKNNIIFGQPYDEALYTYAHLTALP